MFNKMGFGFLRLPKKNTSYDWDTVCEMADRFLAHGGRWFDTCYTYLDGQSEAGIRKCLVERHPRERFQLINKLPGYLCKSYADCEKYFQESLTRCGVDYFDIYMLHWLNRKNYDIAEKLQQFRFLQEKKAAGSVGRIGFSYHDSAALLDEILTAHPEVDVVLLQINYLDWDSAGIESRKCYECCVRHGKKVIAMEPVKGGTLAVLPAEAESLLRAAAPERSPASWALRFVQSLPEVEICLSGMNAPAQIDANLQGVEVLTPAELETLSQVCSLIEQNTAVACTGCRYCVAHCPQSIQIPELFKMLNEICRYPQDDWKIQPAYQQLTRLGGKASSCIACRSCEKHCPQKLPISESMKLVSEKLETR